MPTAVVLSTWTGVAGFLWTSSSRVRRIILASIALRKSDPSSSSAADATTHFKMQHCVRMAPLSQIGHLSLGMEPRKKCPPDLLLAFGAVK